MQLKRFSIARELSGLHWEDRRVENDYGLRLNKLPEAWIALPEVRDLRELVRYRAKRVAPRTGFRA